MKGREVVVKWGKTKSAVGFVAEFDPNEGITIMDLDGKEKLYCLNKSITSMNSGTYEERFAWAVKAIERGTVSEEELKEAFPLRQSIICGGMTPCAFE